MMKLQRVTLLVDQKKCIANIQAMLARTQELGITFRPHFKTHQSIEIGRWYRQLGVKKITVSSLKMAKEFAADGWDDITVAVPTNANQHEEINALASRINLNILVEDCDSVTRLSNKLLSSIGVFIKIDTGFHRTGIDVNNTKEIEELMHTIKTATKMIPKGLLTYSGQTHHAKTKGEILAIHKHSIEAMSYLKQILLLDFPNIKLSIGDTPSCKLASDFGAIDEIRPGTFLFNDCIQKNIGACSGQEIASIVVAPIIAIHPERNEIVLHCGATHLSRENIVNADGKISFGEIVLLEDGEGTVYSDTGAYISNLSQEHGIVSAPSFLVQNCKVGDTLGIIPIHCCLTHNLMRERTQVIEQNKPKSRNDIRQIKWIYDSI